MQSSRRKASSSTNRASRKLHHRRRLGISLPTKQCEKLSDARREGAGGNEGSIGISATITRGKDDRLVSGIKHLIRKAPSRSGASTTKAR